MVTRGINWVAAKVSKMFCMTDLTNDKCFLCHSKFFNLKFFTHVNSLARADEIQVNSEKVHFFQEKREINSR